MDAADKRHTTEPTENTVSIDTASHLYASMQRMVDRLKISKVRSKVRRTDTGIQQPAHMPSGYTTALRKYRRAFWVSQLTTPPPPTPTP